MNKIAVALMGLTFLCNRCVEVLYKFVNQGDDSKELKETCELALNAFKALRWPKYPPIISSVYFNTNEEIDLIEKVLNVRKLSIDEMIVKLQFALKFKDIKKRKRTAKELQIFFDFLGDESFYATKDYLRGEGA